MLLIATLFFILLSPGVLLTLPPVGSKILMSGKTSLMAVLVHAVVFYVLLSCRHMIPLVNRIEGFANSRNIGDQCNSTNRCSVGYCKPETNKCAKKPLNYSCNTDNDCDSGFCNPENQCKSNVSCTTNNTTACPSFSGFDKVCVNSKCRYLQK